MDRIREISDKVPGKMSFITDRSRCLNCGKQILWYDNIPIISYIILKGKCRYCKTRIPVRLVSFELFFGLLFIIIFNIIEY